LGERPELAAGMMDEVMLDRLVGAICQLRPRKSIGLSVLTRRFKWSAGWGESRALMIPSTGILECLVNAPQVNVLRFADVNLDPE
jgi:hypothetical protein